MTVHLLSLRCTQVVLCTRFSAVLQVSLRSTLRRPIMATFAHGTVTLFGRKDANVPPDSFATDLSQV